MLCKLLKYDFKSMLRIFLPLWALILVTTIFQTFMHNFGIQMGNDILFLTNSTASAIYGIATIVLTALLVATFVLCTVLIIQRFYKGLLRDEGYLMFTLPVKPWQLVLSKLIVAVTIFLLSGVVAIGAWLIFMMIPFLDILSAFSLEPAFAGLVAVTVVFYIAQQIARVYLAMSIGHLFQKHRIATAIVAYIGLQTLVNQASQTFATEFSTILSLTYSVTGALESTCPYILAIAVVELLISIFVTQLILSRRLNLE